jgi:uncharacterized circularly permuted ATP-grasp superfamily protein
MTVPLPAAPPFTDGWNEAFAAPGRPRPLYGSMLRALERVDMTSLTVAVGESMEAAQATFGSDPLFVCPIPRLIESGEWAALSAGLVQRVRALSAFVADAYGPRAIVRAGIVPAAVIDDAEGYEPELRGRWPRGSASLGVVGLDVVRDTDGQFRVLEDNARTPSGFAYAVAAREAVMATLGRLAPAVGSATPSPVPLEPAIVAALRATMRDAAKSVLGGGATAAGGEVCVVVLTDGPGSTAFFEHATAARWLRAPLVTLDDLERRGDEVWLRAGDSGPARRVDAIFRRTDIESLRDEHGLQTSVAELLLEPWLAGRLAVVNAFGTGVADDKLAHAYVEPMIRFYLREEPLLGSVETLDLNDQVVREHVLADLQAHVIKPRHGHGGHGVVVCAHAGAGDVQRVEAALRRPDAGAEYVAQPTLALSVHPTIVDGRLEERHIDLRPFAFATRDSVQVVPGGLTRVAREAGALVVNSSQDGGVKDTWVLT